MTIHCCKQVVEKRVPLELIWRDLSVSQLFVENKLLRVATHALFRCLVTQMEGVAPDIVNRSRLPADVLVRTLADRDEVVVSMPDMSLRIVNERTRVVRRVFPRNWDPRSVAISNHVLDRGSTGSALAWFAQKIQLLWTFVFGVFHDLSNSIKQAAKKTKQGKTWNRVVRFSSIANLNFGPFRSGAWGKGKQVALVRLLEVTTSHCPRFREAAFKQASLLGQAPSTDADYDAWYGFMSELPSCVEAGPQCKFARWLSVQECWDYHRKEIWLVREVLMEIDADATQHLQAQDTTAMLDAALATKMTTSKTGLLARAPSYITQDLCDGMDMFNHITSAGREMYQYRTTKVKTPIAGLQNSSRLLRGDWDLELLETITAGFFDDDLLETLGVRGGTERGTNNSEECAAFTLHLLTERATRLLPAILDYPHVCVGVLDSSLEHRVRSKTSAAQHCWMLLGWEQDERRGVADIGMVLQTIVWTDNAVIRLFLHTVATESALPDVGPQSAYIARAISTHLPDEKTPEDVHQHIRDRQRARRHKHIAVHSVYDAQIGSGVLEERDIPCPVVSAELLSQTAWRSLSSKERCRVSYLAAPQVWPEDFNGILKPSHWSSPTVPGIANAYIAFSWLVHWTAKLKKVGGAASSWWSRLVPLHAIVVLEDADGVRFVVCLFSGLWGIIAAKVIRASLYCYEMSVVRGSIVLEHITSAVQVLAPVVGAYSPGKGIVLEPRSGPQSLIEVTLRARGSLNKWELKQMVVALEAPHTNVADLDPLTEKALLNRLVPLVFPGDPALVAEILDAYARPKPAKDEYEMDEETCDLVEEMAVSDQINLDDLKNFRDEIKKKSMRKLAAAADAGRKAAFAAKSAKKKKTLANRKLKPNGFARRKAAKLKAAKVGPERTPLDAGEAKKPKVPLAGGGAGGASSSGGAGVSGAGVPTSVAATVEGKYAAPPEKGGWVNVRVPRGTLRFNDSQGRLDAHCSYHKDCKCDRVISRGPLGLHIHWLSLACETKEEHYHMKEVVSSAASFVGRQNGRKAFNTLAETNGGKWELVRNAEAKIRGTADEPASLPCTAYVPQIVLG